MLQDSRLQSIFEVLKVIPREFGIDPLVHELKLDEGKKTLISLANRFFSKLFDFFSVYLVFSKFKKY